MNYKRYNTLSDYYKKKFNNKVSKVPINLGFTCPNKDGSKGYGGCTYCSSLSSGDFAGNPHDSIKAQFESVRQAVDKKWPNSSYILYFQAGTNTYAPLGVLKDIFTKALDIFNRIVGISIATRADALDEEKVAFLASLNKKIPITVELGLQNSNEKTSSLINRCHTNKEFEDAIHLLNKYNLEIVVHIINGLPHETKEDMLNTIRYINQFDIQGIKIHSLCLITDSKMGQDYLKNPFKILTLEEYTDIVCDELRLLNPNIIIHRLSADAKMSNLIEPKWSVRKIVVMNEIDKKMRKENYHQGDLFQK